MANRIFLQDLCYENHGNYTGGNYFRGKNITESLLIALQDYISRQRLKKLIR